jgi:hypothetical protein
MSEAQKKIPRPLPRVNVYMNTKPFWDAAKDGRLVIQYCKDTGKPQFFPRPVSLATGRRNLEWRQVSGKGKVYSFTTTYSAWPGMRSACPTSAPWSNLTKACACWSTCSIAAARR